VSQIRSRQAALAPIPVRVTIKIWHLGSVLFAVLLAIAVFVGYSLAPRQAPGDSSGLSLQLAQKDQMIATLQAQIATSEKRQALQQAIAVDQNSKSAAQANVRSVLPDVESYNADNVPGALAATDPDFATSNADSGYSGMTANELRVSYDQAFPASVWVDSSDPGFPQEVTGITSTTANYCVVSHVGDWYSWRVGPGGTIQVTQSSAVVCTA
jgi:hypothetical protein